MSPCDTRSTLLLLSALTLWTCHCFTIYDVTERGPRRAPEWHSGQYPKRIFDSESLTDLGSKDVDTEKVNLAEELSRLEGVLAKLDKLYTPTNQTQSNKQNSDISQDSNIKGGQDPPMASNDELTKAIEGLQRITPTDQEIAKGSGEPRKISDASADSNLGVKAAANVPTKLSDELNSIATQVESIKEEIEYMKEAQQTHDMHKSKLPLSTFDLPDYTSTSTYPDDPGDPDETDVMMKKMIIHYLQDSLKKKATHH